MRKTLMISVMLSVVVLAIGTPAQDDVSAELKRLRGSWRLVDEIDDGRQMPKVESQKYNILTFEITGNWKVEIDGKVVGEGTAKIDPTRLPKTIDYIFTGEHAGGQFIAIYELSGDSFRHCGVLQGNRPSEFSSKPGSGQILTTFRREK
jgi:uncharacterized protein (TIGR03067 family)